MITVITRYEPTQMPRDLEHRMWRQLKGAFDFRQLIFVEDDDQMREALAQTGDTHKVFLEPTGHKTLSDMPGHDDIVFVLGNTALHNLRFVDPEDAYRINTPKPTDLYGINAAAIALAYRVGQ